MKFFHLSDLHIGKRVCGFSMLEDQKYILQQILSLAREHRPDGVLIAGDLYDKSMPSAEAVETVDWFLSQFAAQQIPVWAISGNHDCAERVAYGGQMLEQAGIYVSRVFDGELQRYELPEGIDIYLLPYLRPAQVRRYFPEQTIETTQQAVEAVLGSVQLRSDRRNILVMHQFLTGASVCDSEELTVGGLDQVDASAVAAFDYVALGHLHRPQCVGREEVRYCGSLLKYSFSEANDTKSVTVVEVRGTKSAGNKGAENQSADGCTAGSENTEGAENQSAVECNAGSENTESAGKCRAENNTRITVTTLPLTPRRDLREIRGPIEALLQREVSGAANPEDYLHVTLTDEEGVLDAIGRLREVYPNIMRLDFAHAAEAEAGEAEMLSVEEKTPQELFAEFFRMQNGREMNEAQKKIADELLRMTGSGEERPR